MFHKVNPVVDLSVRILCARPYGYNEKRYSHPKGCPNFNKKDGCPPQAKLITDLLDFTKPIYAIWNIFDFESHCNRMRKLHPEWSQRQVECCLYWQPKARKQLRIEVQRFLRQCKCLLGEHVKILKCPEANGVNVNATMKSIGHILEWPPKTITYQIVLAGATNFNRGDER